MIMQSFAPAIRAAVLGLAIGVSALSAFGSAVVAGAGQVGPEPATPVPLGAIQNPGVLGSVTFLTPRIGWITVGDRNDARAAASKTTNGGRSWQRQLVFNYARSRDGGGLVSTWLHFVDPEHGFLYPGPGMNGHPTLTLYRTGNGGRSWRRMRLPHYLYQDQLGIGFSFVGRLRGWVLGMVSGGMNSNGADVASTSNGGLTWRHVARATVPAKIWGGIEPGVGFKESILFADPRTGWIFGGANGGLDPNWHTTDAGNRWRIHMLPRPPLPGCPKKAWWQTRELTPALFGPNRGLLPVELWGAVGRVAQAGGISPCHKPGFLVYRLNGLGSAWVGPRWISPAIPLIPAHAGNNYNALDQLVSPRVWFFANRRTLARTTNGGRSWVSIRPDLPKNLNIAGIHFLGPRTGFLWASEFNPGTAVHPGPEYASSSYVEFTSDGGSSWRPLVGWGHDRG
jgi:photosystem II stability/assembly factor-like uncharacterized protein